MGSKTSNVEPIAESDWTADTMGGNFGHLGVSEPPPLEGIDMTAIGMQFAVVERPAHGIKQAEVIPVEEPLVDLTDTRTNEEVREEALKFIVNALDLPDDVVQAAKKGLRGRTEEFRDFVMRDVVPIVLCVGPALNSVQQMIPRMFDDGGDGVRAELPIDKLTGYAATLGLLSAQMKLIDMAGLSEEVRARLLARLIPEITHREKVNG